MLGSSIAEEWHVQRPKDALKVLTRSDVDLRDRSATSAVIAEYAPDTIIHAAAKVGGIAAKIAEPASYLLDNLLIDTSVVSGAINAAVPEFIYIGSGAMYPEHFRQPFLETDLLAGPLEEANEGYAIAKIAATKLCEYASAQYGYAYRVAVPSNLYGPNEDCSLSHGHLIAAALAKVDAAKQDGRSTVSIWGDGSARREFTFSRDVAEWIVTQVGRVDGWPALLNLGVGLDHTIKEYYDAARVVVGFDGEFEYDLTKPSGMRQRLLDSSAARALGWAPQTSLLEGMTATYSAFNAVRRTPPSLIS